MLRVHSVLPLHILLLTLLAIFIASPAAHFEITGALVDREQAPLAGLTVKLLNEHDEQIASDQTDAQGRFRLVYESKPTSSDPFSGADLPTEFKLGSSYPNPFNPRTTVPFHAPENTSAVITVYNILGQQVLRTGADISAGTHEIQVNLGGRLSQGQYILRVQGEGFSLSQIMTFVSAGIGGGNPEIRVRQGGQASNHISSSMHQVDSDVQYRIVVEQCDRFQRMELFIAPFENLDMGSLVLDYIQCVDLITGKSIVVGHVCIQNDKKHLIISYQSKGNWQLIKSHLAVSTERPGGGEWMEKGWQARAGDPAPDQFPYSTEYHQAREWLTYHHTYTIALEDIAAGLEVGDDLFIAAHASMKLGDQKEDAWGDGDRFTNELWETYLNYHLRYAEENIYQTLEPGGVVIGIDGVTVTAPVGALDKPVNIRIERVDDPRKGAPFPEYLHGVETHSRFYELKASKKVHAHDGHMFVLSFPVDDDQGHADRAIAMLYEPESVLLRHLDLDASHLWHALPSLSNEETDFLSFPFPFIPYDSLIATLIDKPSSLVVSEGSGTSKFQVICAGWKSSDFCRPAHVDKTQQALDKMYNRFVKELDFRRPRLHSALSNEYPYFDSSRYLYLLLEDVDKDGRYRESGRYMVNSQLAITFFEGGETSPCDTIAYHEFFHALQFGFPKILEHGLSRVPLAVLEGTASMAMYPPSWNQLTRYSVEGERYGPLKITTPLLSTSPYRLEDYASQDFWVYLGKRMKSPDPGFLIPFFNRGGRKIDLDAWLRQEGTFASLSDAYWSWVKNQAFEKRVHVGTHMSGLMQVPSGASCDYSFHGDTPKFLTFIPENAPHMTYDWELSPLSSKVVQIDLKAGQSEYTATVDLESNEPTPGIVKSRFYLEEDAGSEDCISPQRDITPTEFTVSAGDEGRTIFLLLANTDIKYTDIENRTLKGSVIVSVPSQTLTVTKEGQGAGTVVSSPEGIYCGLACSNEFAKDTEVTLTATPDHSSIFMGWSGAGCSGTGVCVVTMDEDHEVTAVFEAGQLTVRKLVPWIQGTVSHSTNHPSVGDSDKYKVGGIPVYRSCDDMPLVTNEHLSASASVGPGGATLNNALSFDPGQFWGRQSMTLSMVIPNRDEVLLGEWYYDHEGIRRWRGYSDPERNAREETEVSHQSYVVYEIFNPSRIPLEIQVSWEYEDDFHTQGDRHLCTSDNHARVRLFRGCLSDVLLWENLYYCDHEGARGGRIVFPFAEDHGSLLVWIISHANLIGYRQWYYNEEGDLWAKWEQWLGAPLGGLWGSSYQTSAQIEVKVARAR